jgi:hypothetical protein
MPSLQRQDVQLKKQLETKVSAKMEQKMFTLKLRADLDELAAMLGDLKPLRGAFDEDHGVLMSLKFDMEDLKSSLGLLDENAKAAARAARVRRALLTEL